MSAFGKPQRSCNNVISRVSRAVNDEALLMELIVRMHPSGNWLRVRDTVYRSALERNIAKGAPDMEHFWGVELPALLQHPKCRRLPLERVTDLQAKSDAI